VQRLKEKEAEIARLEKQAGITPYAKFKSGLETISNSAPCVRPLT
jgi:hypothetical protein